MKKLRVWTVADSHGFHDLLEIPENIDVLIFAGDESNYHDVARNSVECRDFLYWLHNNCIDIPHKIMIAGNHSAAIASGFISREEIEQNGVKYLYNEGCEIEGRTFWGSPVTPSFNDWYFMRKRGKLAPLWNMIPYNLDVLITHGPPKGILDLTVNPNGSLEQVGDKELWNEILIKKPKNVVSGHVHDCKDILNAGMLKLSSSKYETTFYNSSVVKDGKFGQLYSNGNIFEI